MVDFDLSKLSAPLEALRSDVDEAYKRLDARWNDVSEALSKLPIPYDISYTYHQHPDFYPDCTCLEWRKWKGSKRVCIVSYTLDEVYPGVEDLVGKVTPYEEWSAQQRINMLSFVPNLFEAATKQTIKFIESTKK